MNFKFSLYSLTVILAAISGIALLISGIAYGLKPESKELKITVIATSTVFGVIFILAFVWSVNRHGLKWKAHEVLAASNSNNQAEFSKECDIMFKSQPNLYEQYKVMKQKRPQEEVNNLCGNTAKGILKIK